MKYDAMKVDMEMASSFGFEFCGKVNIEEMISNGLYPVEALYYVVPVGGSEYSYGLFQVITCPLVTHDEEMRVKSPYFVVEQEIEDSVNKGRYSRLYLKYGGDLYQYDNNQHSTLINSLVIRKVPVEKWIREQSELHCWDIRQPFRYDPERELPAGAYE